MKVRIFALAKELGIDAKELVKHCADAGVIVKSSSALASISEEERDIVVGHIKSQQASQTIDQPSEPLAPVRETARPMGKVRAIKAMVPRGQAARLSRPEPAPESSAPQVETTAAAAVEEQETAPPEEQEPDVAVPVGDSEAVAAATEPTDDIIGSVEETEGTDETGVGTEVVSEEATAEVLSGEDAVAEGEQQPPPLTRDQFAPIRGADAATPIRDMRSRGSAGEGTPRTPGRGKTKSKPSFPYLAAPPSYKLPKVPKEEPKEERAQKPDLKLTADFLEQQSPLAAHLRKHAEQKRRKKEDAPFEKEGEADGGRGGGLGLVEAREQRREKRKLARRSVEDEGESSDSRSLAPRRRRPKRPAPAGLKTSAVIEMPVTVRGFCEAVGRPSSVVIKHLFQMGHMLTINDVLDEETALEVALELGVDLEFKRPRNIEDELDELLEASENEESLVVRAPIITVLGHVDHGKTSLLDRIRASSIASGEAGGITQHIAAYQVEHQGQKLTFVDTPGHAAFGEMRARGADVTDIVVLVVAADDGVMPQTVECISHAKAAGVPIIVALNKMDLPDVKIDKVLADLAAHGITAHEWGGDTEVVRTSAATGEGVDKLLETLLLTAELHEIKADPNRPALGVCLEAFRDERRGPLSWFIVQKGTLRIGDVVLCGSTFGRIRSMHNEWDEEIEEAEPSSPVIVAGLDDVPGAGDHFFVLDELDHAREAADDRRDRGRAEVLTRRRRPRKLEDILDAARGGKVQDLPLILKVDAPGSLEALRSEIEKFEHPEVRVSLIHEGVGGVNESDVYLASASGAIIVAFHVIAEDRAVVLAEREGVEIRRYNIIYEVTDQIKRTLEGLLLPEELQVPTGRALVLQTFNVSRHGTVAGCRVLNGTIERSNRVHVIRDQKVLNDYGIASLRRVKDDVKEVREGMECGIRLEGFNDVKEGDLFEAFRIDIVKRTLD